MLGVDAIQSGKEREVGHVYGGSKYMRKRTSRSIENGAEICDDLPGLDFDRSFDEALCRGIEGDLAGYKEQSTVDNSGRIRSHGRGNRLAADGPYFGGTPRNRFTQGLRSIRPPALQCRIVG